ncbi:helix-turn-helix domain-containing protein [Bdellovibrio sp. HCB185ZH]|uniref:helix-turn-helix domain-containing protein n=1 Tax=Bdellovibrio sp. HCB185ZH TaxID=3394235 RepID=UPI0039A548F6
MCTGDKLSICIRNSKNEVLFQNEASQKTCGSKAPGVCGNSACAEMMKQVEEAAPVQDGMKLHKGQHIEGQFVDVMLVKDGENVMTFLYPIKNEAEKQAAQEAFFVNKGLTPSEIRIMHMVTAGMTNQQIADKLFISKATLKTHLNNAYKKLPPSMRPTQGRVA